jgi:hypothetical protein
MSREHVEQLDPRITSALDELQILIRTRYPDAQFAVVRDVDDPLAIHLTTTVDTEEPEDVVDIVIDRLLELQVEERLPIHVIPLRPIERLVSLEEVSVSNPQALLGNAPQA